MSDPRGNLALTFLALADRVKPKWIVWENVPGVLSSNGGRDFGAFLGALVELGYGFAYRVLDAQYFGVPQRRRRVFVVACLGDWRSPAEVLSLTEGLLGYIEKGKQKRKGTTTDAPASVDASGLQRTVGTLCADTHPGAYSGQDAYTGRLIPDPTPFRKSKRAQSVTDDESWVADGKANTLNNFDLGDTRTTHAVVEPIPLDLRNATRDPEKHDEVNRQGVGVGDAGDPANTLTKEFCHGVAQPIAIQGTIIGRGDNAGPQGVGASEGGPMYTLTKTDVHGVLYENHPNDSRVTGPHDVAPTVVTRFGTGGGNVPLVQQDAHVAYGTDCYNGAITGNVAATMGTSGSSVNAAGPTVMQSMAVRRLTPVECERLQGFPDNWSRIPWKGKTEEQCPDGPRYKACGNSMAVPVMRWIGERIKAVDATLAK
jgi:DNA (cytosine-5)-methyltransferase 1